MAPEWINKRSRLYWYDQYAMNEQETAFSRYDPDRIVEELVGVGADIVAVYATNQFGIAYYPSAIWPQHPNLEGRDYFGDLVSRLQARGKKVIAYANFLDSKHAEWNSVPLEHEDAPAFTRERRLAKWADPSSPSGRVQALAGGQWNRPCMNSPHGREVVAVAEEIGERYRPEMFHLDMFYDPYVCACRFCRPELERLCGTTEITMEVLKERWIDYVNWRLDKSASLLAGVSAVVRRHGALAAHNAMAPLFFKPFQGLSERWLDSIDVFVSECFDAFGHPLTDLNSTSITVRWQHAVGKPAWILRTGHQSHYAHWPISRAQWELYAAACKANGCKAFGPCGIGARPDTTSSKRLLDHVKHGFDFYMRDADLDEGAVSAAKIALVFSWASRNYYSDDMDWVEEFTGWARLMIEEHLPYDVVTAERITRAADLAKYDLVVLPNVANTSESFCNLVRQYVQDGGRILATAETSLRDERGSTHENFALGDVLGISRARTSEGHFAIERPVEPEPASGKFQEVRGTGRVLSRKVSVDPAGSVGGCKDPMPLEVADAPVATVNDFGKGKALYVAFDIGHYFSTHGDEHIGTWMAELIDTVLPERQVLVKAPRTVEITVWRQPRHNRTILHLANRTAPWTLPTSKRQITEIIPVHDVELTLKRTCDSPKVTCRGAEIFHRMDADTVVVSLAKIGPYAAVVIE